MFLKEKTDGTNVIYGQHVPWRVFRCLARIHLVVHCAGARQSLNLSRRDRLDNSAIWRGRVGLCATNIALRRLRIIVAVVHEP